MQRVCTVLEHGKKSKNNCEKYVGDTALEVISLSLFQKKNIFVQAGEPFLIFR